MMKIHLPEDIFNLSKPKGASDLVIGDLSPFLRAALLTDGTLTNLLSCFFNEGIVARPTLTTSVNCGQPSIHSENSWVFNQPYALFDYFLASDQDWLAQSISGAMILKPLEVRSAYLHTQESQQLVAMTHSVLAVHALPVSFVKVLADTPAGLGQALRNEKIEHFRSLFWYGALPIKYIKPFVVNYNMLKDDMLDDDMLLPARVYGLFIQQKLVMTIAECFIHPLFMP